MLRSYSKRISATACIEQDASLSCTQLQEPDRATAVQAGLVEELCKLSSLKHVTATHQQAILQVLLCLSGSQGQDGKNGEQRLIAGGGTILVGCAA